MNEEELKAALAELQKKLEGKSKEEAKSAVEAFKKEQKTAIESLKGDFKDVLDSKLIELEEKHKKAIKVVQDHADKLDAKLKTAKSSKEEKKSFQQVLGEALIEKTDSLEKFNRKEIKEFDLELKVPGDISTGNVTGDRYGELFDPNIVDRPNRRVYMSQILPGGSLGPGNSFTHMREAVTSPTTNEGNPAPVAEGATKPQFDYDLEENTVQIENIAGWMRVTKKAMRNIPGFISFLQRRIPDRFMRVLDNQILYGDGTSPNLKGLLTTGNFIDRTTAVNKPVAEKIIDYLSEFEDSFERLADGVLVRPATYYSMFTQKATGSGEYDLPHGFTMENGVLRGMGVPIIRSTAVNATDIVVGEWAQGAQFLTQESMRIEFFEQDGDNVRNNKVTIRVEGDFALPVYGPDYFMRGTTATV